MDKLESDSNIFLAVFLDVRQWFQGMKAMEAA